MVGRGDAAALRRAAGPVADRLDVLGPVDDATKAAALRSVDVFCAPNLGGESFGMVLTEAMAAGAPVLASDLGAFRAVLDGGRACCSRPATPTRWPRELAALLDDPARRAALRRRRAGPGRRVRLAGRRRLGGAGLIVAYRDAAATNRIRPVITIPAMRPVD